MYAIWRDVGLRYFLILLTPFLYWGGHILKYFIQDLFLLSKCLTYYTDNFVCFIKTYLFVYLPIYFFLKNLSQVIQYGIPRYQITMYFGGYCCCYLFLINSLKFVLFVMCALVIKWNCLSLSPWSSEEVSVCLGMPWCLRMAVYSCLQLHYLS